MALLTTISETNRIDEQGGAWEISIRPTGTFATTGAVPVTYTQWKCAVSFTKSYRYVGLTKVAANTIADTIRAAYTKDRTRTIVRWDMDNTRWEFSPVADVESPGAVATPSLMEGRIWQIAVSVAASLEVFTNTTAANAPTADNIKALLADLDNYPEMSYTPPTGGAM